MPARPTTSPPMLKRDKGRGFFYTRWGGRLHTFGTDEREATRKFLSPDSDHPGALHRWQQWAAAKAERAGRSGPGTGGARAPAIPLVIDLAERFFESYASRPDAERYYRKHLARCVTMLGALRADMIDEQAIEALKSDIEALGFAPKTVSHDVKAVKTMWRWACRVYPASAVPRLDLSQIKVPRQTLQQPNAVSRERLLSMIDKARTGGGDDDGLLAECLRLTYYALLRPSELIRILACEGRFEPIIYPDLRPWDPDRPHTAENRVEPKGLYVIRSKVEHRTAMPRYVVLTERGRMSIDAVQDMAGARRRRGGWRRGDGVWARLDTYSAAVRAATGLPPSVVRDTAASDLHSLGVEWASIDLLLGHVPTGAGRSYIQPAWHTLREQASRLRL